MEPTSPLSLFEAVFKVIEERIPLGRHLVTLTSSLMLAVIIVFCVGYLSATFGVGAHWIILSLRTKSFVPFPRSLGFGLGYNILVVVVWFYFFTTILTSYLNTRTINSLISTIASYERSFSEINKHIDDLHAQAKQIDPPR